MQAAAHWVMHGVGYTSIETTQTYHRLAADYFCLIHQLIFSFCPYSCFFFFSSISLCHAPQQHKHRSHSLCSTYHSSLLFSGAMHVRYSCASWEQTMLSRSVGGLQRSAQTGRSWGRFSSGGENGTWRYVDQQQQLEHRGRRPDAWDADRRKKAVKEEVCRLISIKASVLAASANYYQRARNKGFASGWATQESC